MSHFQPVALDHASRLINHGPTVLITSRNTHGSRRNVMAAAWSMPVEFTPPRIAIVVDKSTFTRELILESGVFGICIPAAAFTDLTYELGSTTGKDIDKFSTYNLDAKKGQALGLPLLENESVAWLECRLIPEPHMQDAYDTFVGEVVAAAADSRAFVNGRWSFTDANSALHTIHHLGAGNFVRAGSAIKAKPLS